MKKLLIFPLMLFVSFAAIAQTEGRKCLECDPALVTYTDIRQVQDRNTLLSILSVATETNYREILNKWNGSADVKYKFGLFDADASASYENFEKRRNEIFSKESFIFDEEEFIKNSEKYLPALAYEKWGGCIEGCRKEFPDLYLTIEKKSIETVDLELTLIKSSGDDRIAKVTDYEIDGGRIKSGKRIGKKGFVLGDENNNQITINRNSGESLSFTIYTDYNNWNASIPTLEATLFTLIILGK